MSLCGCLWWAGGWFCVCVCERAHVCVCFFTCVGAGEYTGLLWKLTNSVWGSVYTFLLFWDSVFLLLCEPGSLKSLLCPLLTSLPAGTYWHYRCVCHVSDFYVDSKDLNLDCQSCLRRSLHTEPKQSSKTHLNGKLHQLKWSGREHQNKRKSTWGGKGFFGLHFRITVQHPGNSGQELGGRCWRRSFGGMLFAGLFFVAHSGCFLISSRTACPEMAPPVVTNPPQQSLAKRAPFRLAYRQVLQTPKDIALKPTLH